MNSLQVNLRQVVLRVTRCLLLVAPILSIVSLPAFAAPAATPAGPNGTNVGINFNWNNGPNGYSASYIQSSNSSGSSLDNCGGAVTSSTSTCDFAFTYEIGGVAQTAVQPGGVYDTWDGTCEDNPYSSAPLTIYNCFNQGPFGQIFLASATGTLSNFTMPMTCLNPTGATITNVEAYLYQVNAGGASIPATPIASVPVNLSSCPTLTSWTGHTFSSSDFAPILLNFSGATLTAGNLYAVYIAPTLTISLSSGSASSLTVVPGSSSTATYTFTVTPAYSTFTNPVTFSVSGQPAGSTVYFDPSSIAAGASQTTVTMFIQVPPPGVAQLHRGSSAGVLAFCLPMFPILGLCFFRKSAWVRYLGMFGVLVLGVSLMSFVGCGGTNYSGASANTVTVTATSGGLSQSANVTLNVQ